MTKATIPAARTMLYKKVFFDNFKLLLPFLKLIADSDYRFDIILRQLFSQIFHMRIYNPVISDIILIENLKNQLFPCKTCSNRNSLKVSSKGFPS